MKALSRSRASLLAGSMFATTALAGLGGIVGAIVLMPGAVLAQTCTPAPAQGAPPAVQAIGPGGFEAPIVATAAQDIWYATAPWQDRQADLRDSALLSPNDHGGFTPGVWIKAVGDWTSRTDKIDPPAGFTFDLDYRQDTYGVVAGIDGAGRVGGGVGLIGIAGGYLNSQLNFNSHIGLADQNYDGGTAAVYATWLMDQFFIDGMFKVDFLTLRANAFGGSGSINVDTYGGRFETGYRIPIGSGTLEPVGTLGYTTTTIGNANVLGTVLHWGSENSFRGALGLRFSLPVVTNDSYMIKLAVDGRVWDEFDGRNQAVLLSGSPLTAVGVGDNFSGAFGEVGGAMNLFSRDGHSSAFITGSYKFKTNYNEGKVAIGYRYQWGAPPPPPPPPPPAPVAKDFVVYFPFDQYVLTPEAQSVVQQAADYAKSGNATTVTVVGHTDTSGGFAYNMRLSERRAKATADALVGQGVNQTVLKVDWKGKTDLAVQTPDGVKEPLNRRSTISINF